MRIACLDFYFGVEEGSGLGRAPALSYCTWLSWQGTHGTQDQIQIQVEGGRSFMRFLSDFDLAAKLQ